MVRFDRIIIQAPISYAKWVNEEAFKDNKFSRTRPSKIRIHLNKRHQRLTLEFTGKILGDSYPSLINKNTFLECLNRIEDIGIITFDKEGIMEYGDVISCDVTCDVCYSEVDRLIKYIKANLSDYEKWATTKYSNGVELHNNVVTKELKKRLVLYNKEQEIQKYTNKPFLSSVKDKHALLSFFKGKVRFERNLKTKHSIREALEIKETYLSNVLNSSANPIADILKDAIKPVKSTTHHISKLKDLETSLILEACDYDLTKVEAKYREVKSKNTRMSRIMPRFQEFVNRTENFASTFDFTKVIDLVS